LDGFVGTPGPLVRFAVRGQMDRKAATFTHLAADLIIPSMFRDNLMTDRQSQPGSLTLGCKEWIKDIIYSLVRHSMPIV
jgi:hypothetical protein